MAARLAMEQSIVTRPAPLLNSIFMSTVNTAARTLVSIASTSTAEEADNWKLSDHLRYLLMLMIWFTVWVLRVLMDYFPRSVVPFPLSLLDRFSSVGSLDPSPSSSMAMVLHRGLPIEVFDPSTSTKAIGRALTHIFALMNEIPATSRKYQFALAMADKIVDENAREGHDELQEINRTALSFAFARTSNLLYRSLQNNQEVEIATWPSRMLNALPLGSYLVSGLSFCLKLSSFFPTGGVDTCQSERRRQLAEDSESVMAEKLAQELLWITNKLRASAAVEEALFQWSYASGLASLSLTANPRIQGLIVKITAILMRELVKGDMEVPRQVKFRLLVLWLPLFSYASNGLAYPIFTAFEKAEMERVIEDVISSLPDVDQEMILTNWFQDFVLSASDWPDLQKSYDLWCRSSRKLLI
ncbi:hypothetical protein NE237_021748 [Protea cynaroides]|uniref:At3g05675-like ankyrin-like domain-containing protein n=1 Tax=Protea cynaroides TaxID=273540 RepID=A0A9Q0HBS2_9MAGN|nr:hypothetical protein NE237_021748 [Protea cynaroides]